MGVSIYAGIKLSQQPLHSQTFTVETEPIGLLAGALRRRVRSLVEARAQQYGLSGQQFWMFVAVIELEAPSLAAVAHRVRSDLPTASRAMHDLVVQGLVVDERLPDNRRQSRFLLTRKGGALRPKALALAVAVRKAVDAGLSASERRAVRRGLRKVIAHLDHLLDEAGIHAEAAVAAD
jgi:DNA-binding MarR family transcriptional regulator